MLVRGADLVKPGPGDQSVTKPGVSPFGYSPIATGRPKLFDKLFPSDTFVAMAAKHKER